MLYYMSVTINHELNVILHVSKYKNFSRLINNVYFSQLLVFLAVGVVGGGGAWGM